MKYYFIFFLIVTLVACREDKQMGNTPKATATEDFNEFVKRFKTDSIFQVSRIQFPVNAWSYAEDTESPIGLGDSLIVHYTFTLQNYSFFTFEENTQQLYDKYTVETFSEDSTAKLMLSGVDNGISVAYHFSRIDGLWYMVKIVDQST